MPKSQQISLLIIGILIIAASCTRHKDLVYLQQLENDSTNTYSASKKDYKLKAGDLLYIKILGLNQEVINTFNPNSDQTRTSYYRESDVYISGYSINENGYVSIPILGDIKVVDNTIDKARKIIQAKVDEYLKDAVAVVKLVSFRFTVLGEVNQPGLYTNYNDNISIMEALGMAGDINDYGNRREVMLIRQTEEGTITNFIDLTNRDLLTTEGFYLLPNDIVYVKPLKNKAFRSNTRNISITLSVVTTIVVVWSFFLRVSG